MNKMTGTFGIAAILATFAATPLVAQTETTQKDPGLGAARNAAQYLKTMLTQAAEQMSEEDYAFKPTPEVRSFGQLLAHVADSSYLFCARATGVTPQMTAASDGESPSSATSSMASR